MAFGNHSIHDEPGVLQTFEIVFLRGRPALGSLHVARLGAEVEADDVLAIDSALEIDNGHGIADLTFLSRVNDDI